GVLLGPGKLDSPFGLGPFGLGRIAAGGLPDAMSGPDDTPTPTRGNLRALPRRVSSGGLQTGEIDCKLADGHVSRILCGTQFAKRTASCADQSSTSRSAPSLHQPTRGFS